jgi:predicted DNA-binding transcriptional regulator YafY
VGEARVAEAAVAAAVWDEASFRVSAVSIRLVADEIRERRWHASQRLIEDADGGVVLEMTVAAPADLERWLLGYGPDVEVLAPAALAARIRSRHIDAVAHTGMLRTVRPRSVRTASAKSVVRSRG